MLKVAVAIIQDSQGRVLLTRRHASAHQGGLWEFPGGKLEPGESLPEALQREIREELGIEIESHQPLIRITHHYTDRAVQLLVQRVTTFNGIPEGREGQPLKWVAPMEMGRYPMPAADRPIVTAIRLPASYLITGPDPHQPESFLRRLETALQQGQRLIQLRAPGLATEAYRAVALRAVERCRRYGASLLLNADPARVGETAADGVHLNSRRLMELTARPFGADKWVGASCHDLAQLHRAEALKLDFALLSPVLPTASHPAATPIGWDGFQSLVEQVSLPVYALGGMDPTMIDHSREMGGQGIAAIRGLWPGAS